MSTYGSDYREDLKAFVDGELPEARMAEVQAAIESDPELLREVEFMRVLGFEIKKLAAEPSVVGREQTVEKFRRSPLPWWNPATLSGRLAYAGALFLFLGGMGIVLFPVFSQAKMSAKRDMARAPLSAATPYAYRGKAGVPFEAGEERSGMAASPAPLSDDGTTTGGGSGTARNGAEGLNYDSGSSPADQDAFFASKKPMGGGFLGMPPGSPGAKNDSVAEGGYSAESETPANALPETRSPSAVNLGKARASRSAHRPSGAATKPQSTGSPTSPAVEVPPTNRMVIKNADISLKVADAKRSLTEAEALAKSLGGYVEGGNLISNPDQTPRAAAVLRVPSKLYEVAMKALRGMGEVLSEASNAQDVTSQHADLDGRLNVLRAEEDSYVTMLRGAKKIGELMEIKDRLSSVRQEIASMSSQKKALANESALSTIRATFEQKVSTDVKKDEKKSGWDETWAKASNSLSTVGEFLGNLVIYIFVFSPVWLPPVILFWWLGKRAKG